MRHAEKKLRVGLIGGGGIASSHIAGFAKISDLAEIVAVADNSEVTLARRAAELHARPFTDFNEMIEQADLDAVDICLPHHLHTRAILAAAQAGLHILCEKPLCTDEAEAATILSAVRDSGITFMAAHNQVFRPVIREAKAAIDSGRLGKIYSVALACAFRLDLDESSVGWRSNSKIAGGGELIDTGFHPIYLLPYLIGETPTSVYSVLSNHRLGFLEGEDSAELLLEFESGVVGRISTSWAYQPAIGADGVAVSGSEGALFGDDEHIVFRDNAGNEETLVLQRPDTFGAEIRDFAESVQSGSRPEQTADDGAAALRLVSAAYRSARLRTAESLEAVEV